MASISAPEAVLCNLCGLDDTSLLFVIQGRRVVRCRKCGLVYIDRWHSGCSYQGATYFAERNQYITRQDEFRRIFGRVLDRIEKHKHCGRLLDVGCGPGLLLDVARTRGWTVAGLEISEWATRYAGEEVGVPVWCGELSEELFPPLHFDVIVANHTLEHMRDPSRALRMMRRMLKDDGVLAIGVPNFASLMAKLMRSRWKSLLPDQHLWHFTTQTLIHMLNECEFGVLDVYMENHDYSGAHWTKRLVAGAISRVSLRLGWGEAMLVLSRKRSSKEFDIISCSMPDWQKCEISRR